jgi:eukaryotic-like serine/threonine-protein kinase
MQSQWSRRWSITDHSRKFRGGQGRGQRVHDVAGRDGFLKLLSRPGAEQSRKRFAREVTSFSTLGHAGLPALLDENATEWRNREVELFLVLEYIEGCTLAEFVEEHREIDLAMALSTVRRVLEIVAHCHKNDVVHRDIKPNNIVMRQGDGADPVLVDFGLSFNSALEVDGVTRVGEEVGNRFLRLPEHATGSRSPVSDITQVVGLLYYMLTHSEPRVLEDEAGLKPHQRIAERAAVGLAASGGQLIRLLDLFDRAFSTRIDDRFATASELADALDRVTASEPEVRSISELVSRGVSCLTV